MLIFCSHLADINEQLKAANLKPTFVKPLALGLGPVTAFVARSQVVKDEPRIAWHGTNPTRAYDWCAYFRIDMSVQKY